MFAALSGALATGAFQIDGQQYADMMLLHNDNTSNGSPLLHFSSSEPEILSQDEVTEVIARALGTISTVLPGIQRRLPSGDLFNRPAANLLITIESFQQGLIEAPVLKTMLDSNAHYKVSMEDAAVGAGVPEALKDSTGEANEPIVMCVSASEASNICGSQNTVRWNSASREFETEDATVWMSGEEFLNELSEQKEKHAVFNLLSSFVANGGTAKYTTTADGSPAIDLTVGSVSTVLDMSDEADMMLVMELQLMASIPQKLAADRRIKDETPDFFSLAVASLKKLASVYNEDSEHFKVSVAFLDSAVAQVLENFEKLMPNQLVSQVILMEEKIAPMTATARRLLATSDDVAFRPVTRLSVETDCIDFTSSGEPCPPTGGEIERTQVFFWTLVLLIVMLLASTCALVNMDIGRDSLLYAKFITEHDLKND